LPCIRNLISTCSAYFLLQGFLHRLGDTDRHIIHHRTRCAMKLSFEEALIEVWRRALTENAKVVVLGTDRYPVRLTPKRGLRQVDFMFDGSQIRGLEQNPETKSRWAQMARAGKKVMQFLSEGRYMANVVDGKLTLYARGAKNQ